MPKINAKGADPCRARACWQRSPRLEHRSSTLGLLFSYELYCGDNHAQRFLSSISVTCGSCCTSGRWARVYL